MSSRQIYRIDLDTGNFEQLTNTPENSFSPKISPRGELIAFTRWQENNRELWVMNADGSNQRQLTQTTGDERQAIWSPDGKRIIIVTPIDDGPKPALDIINADGTGWRRLIGQTSLNGVLWLPDGKHIIYSGQPTSRSQLFMMNVDDYSVRLLLEDSWSHPSPALQP